MELTGTTVKDFRCTPQKAIQSETLRKGNGVAGGVSPRDDFINNVLDVEAVHFTLFPLSSPPLPCPISRRTEGTSRNSFTQ